MPRARGLIVQRGAWVFRRRRPPDIPGPPYWTRYLGSTRKLSEASATRLALTQWSDIDEWIDTYRSAFDEGTRGRLLEFGTVTLLQLDLLNKRRDQQDALARITAPDPGASDGAQAAAIMSRLKAERELTQTETALKHVMMVQAVKAAKTNPQPAPEGSTITPLVELWQRRAKPKSPGSVAKAKLWAERFAEFIGDATPIETIEPQDVRGFRDAIEASEDYSRVTARHGLATLATLFKHAVDAGLLDANPFAGVTVHVPAPQSYSTASRDKGFTRAQIKTLFAALDTLPHDDHRWTLRLMTYHGLRAQECAILRSDDIAKVEGVTCIHVRDTHGRRIKTKSSARIVPLHPKCKAFAAYAAKRDGYIFEGNGNQISRAKRLQDVLNPWIKEQLGVGTLHGLRHSFRSMCRDLEMPLEVSAAIMGHALPGEHFAYGRRPSVKVLRDWLEKVKPIRL